MGKWTKGVDAALILTGTALGLENIESLLGIIILIIQISWLVFKFVMILIKAGKTGNLEEAEAQVESIIDKLEDMKEDKHEEN